MTPFWIGFVATHLLSLLVITLVCINVRRTIKSQLFVLGEYNRNAVISTPLKVTVLLYTIVVVLLVPVTYYVVIIFTR